MAKLLKKTDAPSLNIQAFIRLRPLGLKEKKAPNFEVGKKEIVIKNYGKTLAFDRVFDDETKQITVYNAVVKPMIPEVLQGYNCTVFAYGQTGTGKTYTMSGEQGDENIHAGIIPRAMAHIFKELGSQTAEYNVSVYYMELYNEKLRSLLDDSEESTAGIQLLDDPEGGVIYKGYLPTPVQNMEDAFKLLEQGAQRRQVAATYMNLNSSRSHTIFTIIVNIKESIPGSDVLRVGKLHLVDLAGSENVSKSGANDMCNKSGGTNRRLNEASSINKSLLTLGRVITSITESNTHVPYRESKLTRLLRDSLGGKTKTCIIGTISPAQFNIEETESTLNYAYKARSIKNKPEMNRKISQKEYLKETTDEIKQLKRDLEAVRQGDGYFISQETHKEMSTRMEDLTTQVRDWNDRYQSLKEQHEQTRVTLSLMYTDYDDKCAEYEELEKLLELEKEAYQKEQARMEEQIKLREYFLQEFEKNEAELTRQATTCKSVLEVLLEQKGLLHDKIDRKSTNEAVNSEKLEEFKATFETDIWSFKETLSTFFQDEKTFTTGMESVTREILDTVMEEQDRLFKEFESFKEGWNTFNKGLLGSQTQLLDGMKSKLSMTSSCLKQEREEEMATLQNTVNTLSSPASDHMANRLKKIKTDLENGRRKLQELSEACQHLKQEKEARQNNLMAAVKKTVAEMENLNEEIQTAFDQVKKNKTSADLAVQKVNEITEAVLVLQNLTREFQEGTDSAEEKYKTALKTTEDVKYSVMNTLVKSATEATDNVDEICKNSEDFCHIQEAALVEVKSGIDDVTKTNEMIMNQIHNVCQNRKKHLEEQGCIGEENLKDIENIVQTYGSDIDSLMVVNNNTTNRFISDVKTKTADLGRNMDSILRETHIKLIKHRDNIEKQVEATEHTINDLVQSTSEVTYTDCLSLGVTPQRASAGQLAYPKVFNSTAPREVLHLRFCEERSKPNKPNDLGDLSELTDEEKINDFEYLPAKSSSCRGRKEASEKVNVTYSVAKQRRRSRSVPDSCRHISFSDFGDNNQEEDKENCLNTRVNTMKRSKAAHAKKLPRDMKTVKLNATIGNQNNILGELKRSARSPNV